MMKNRSSRFEDHPSYKKHRRQLWTQILLPMLLAVLVFLAITALTSVVTFRDHGDVARWAAISTIWLVLPVMLAGLLFLVLLIALIYLVAKVATLIPPYTYEGQRIMYRIDGSIRRVAAMIRRPVLGLKELGTVLRTSLARARDR